MGEFDPKFHEAEEKFRAEAARLHERNDAIKADIRREVDLTPEEREERYIASYKGLSESFDKLANTFAGSVEQDRRELEKKINAGTGQRFGEHLTSLANTPDDKLSELMKTAKRTGQKDLARAIAHTALDRNRYGVFEEWGSSNPEISEALTRLRSIPDLDRLRTRTLALRPFKASPQSLTPTQEDRDRASSHAASQESVKAAFFNRPRRQIGRRTS